jgi:hypothetical protein
MTPEEITALIQQAADQYRLPVDVFRRQIGAESNFNQGAVSPKGAIGLGQLMPGTAQALGVDPRDPAQNVQGAAMYMRQMLNMFGGDMTKALAAYNWGPGNVQKFGLAGMPDETRNYLARITGGGTPSPSPPVGGGPATGPAPVQTAAVAGPPPTPAPAPGPSGPNPMAVRALASQGTLADMLARAAQATKPNSLDPPEVKYF